MCVTYLFHSYLAEPEAIFRRKVSPFADIELSTYVG